MPCPDCQKIADRLEELVRDEAIATGFADDYKKRAEKAEREVDTAIVENQKLAGVITEAMIAIINLRGGIQRIKEVIESETPLTTQGIKIAAIALDALVMTDCAALRGGDRE